MGRQTTTHTPRHLGGALCLDFVNTVDPRNAADRREYLPDFSALVAWSVHAGSVGDDEGRRLAGLALDDPKGARSVHRRAIELREGLYRLISARAYGSATSADDLAALSLELRRALASIELRPSGTRYGWQVSEAARLDTVLGPLVISADALLRSRRLERVRECPGDDGCGWLFLDASKNQTRRWCSMKVCGNRAKARRHRARKARVDGGGEESTSPGPSAGVGRPRSTALDEAILATAEQQLQERGYASMSIESIASSAKTTAPSVRRRYRSKTELAMAIIDSLRVVPLPEPTGEPRADALAILTNFQANLRRRGSLTLLGSLMAEERQHPELIALFRRRLVQPRRAALRGALDAGSQLDELQGNLDVDVAVNMLIGSFYACHLSRGRIPPGWAERALASIWPVGHDHLVGSSR